MSFYREFFKVRSVRLDARPDLAYRIQATAFFVGGDNEYYFSYLFDNITMREWVRKVHQLRIDYFYWFLMRMGWVPA